MRFSARAQFHSADRRSAAGHGCPALAGTAAPFRALRVESAHARLPVYIAALNTSLPHACGVRLLAFPGLGRGGNGAFLTARRSAASDQRFEPMHPARLPDQRTSEAD